MDNETKANKTSWVFFGSCWVLPAMIVYVLLVTAIGTASNHLYARLYNAMNIVLRILFVGLVTSHIICLVAPFYAYHLGKWSIFKRFQWWGGTAVLIVAWLVVGAAWFLLPKPPS